MAAKYIIKEISYNGRDWDPHSTYDDINKAYQKIVEEVNLHNASCKGSSGCRWSTYDGWKVEDNAND